MTPGQLPAQPTESLIFDVGLHRGEDTAYYLNKGYRVVAFEANPYLIEHNRRRFAAEINTGRVVIVEGAISDTVGPVEFYVHPTLSVWGTANESWADRNSPHGESQRVEVPAVDFDAALKTYGVPHYMKIDIEGADQVCLKALSRGHAVPSYLSIESEMEDWDRLVDEFDRLEQLGYRRFSLVQQDGISRRPPFRTESLGGEKLTYLFEEHSSGPFGDDLTHWVSRDAALAAYRKIFKRYQLLGAGSLVSRSAGLHRGLKKLGRVIGQPVPGWYDTHATTRL